MWISILYILYAIIPIADSQTICYGQDFNLEHENTTLLLSQLQSYFAGCEYVYNNLEIVFPQMTLIPVQFSTLFSAIREIKGYLLLENIETDTLLFTNLIIIRGNDFTLNNNVSNALVLKNTKINSIIFPNLREISNFGVYVYNNGNISSACNLHGINWTDILNAYPTYTANLSTNCSTQNCTACQSNYCWTENNCQTLSRVNCVCSGDRCLTSDTASCCEPFCSAGCEGTTSTCNACSMCQDFTLAAASQCLTAFGCQISSGSPKVIASGYISPPRLTAAGTCNSPLILFRMDSINICIRQCDDSLCVEGAGTNSLQCRACQTGESVCAPYTPADGTIPALNVPLIPKSACNLISTQSIRLAEESFNPINPVTPVYLEAFSELREITDYLVIENYPSFYGEVFNFLSRLTRIGGNTLYLGEYSLFIRNNAFREIDLRSLQSIERGSVLIENNTELCYLPTNSGFGSIAPGIQLTIRGQNPNCSCHTNCEQSRGCWGPSNTQCIQCAQVEINNTCLENCDPLPNTYADLINRVCVQCDQECINCTGTATNCTQCRNLRENGECIPSCSTTNYQNGFECLPCNSNCKTNDVNGSICSGPTNVYGLEFNGCNECRLYAFESVNSTNITSNYSCVSACVGGYPETNAILSPECNPCDLACTSCTGPLIRDCETDACTFFLQENSQQCVLSCPNDTQYSPAERLCRNCDSNCIGCTGDTSEDCTECRFFRRGTDCVTSCRNNEYITNSNECDLCDELCDTCSVSRDNCTSCSTAAFYENGSLVCLDACPPGYYRAINISCLTCNIECINCTGALDTDCEGTCRNFLLNPADRCVRECPSIADINNSTKICTISSSLLQPAVIAGIAVSAVILLAIAGGVVIAIIVGTVFTRRYKKKRIEVERKAEGTLLPMREKGQIQRTVQGMPELTILGYNYELLAAVTPSTFPLNEIDESSLDLRDRLGKGFYGYVYSGIYRYKLEEEFPVAVKTFYEIGLKANFQTEFEGAIRVMSRMSHSSFAQVFGYRANKTSPFIVTQLLVGPSLHTLFSQYSGTICEERIFNIIIQIGDGMSYLESHNLVYGILTARNILLVQQNQIKITDSLVHRFSEPMLENALDLPIIDRWMSPELALSRTPTPRSDVWAYGVVFWEMLSFAQMPYNTVANDDVVKVLQQGQRLAQPKACTVDLYGFLLQCFIFEPTGRPSFQKLQNDLVEMAKSPLKYIFIQEECFETLNVNTQEQPRIAKNDTLVIGNTNANKFKTLTQEDLPTEELGLGEYIDEAVVNKNIDEKLTAEFQTAPLIDNEYSEIDAQTNNQIFINEYSEIESPTKYSTMDSIPESQLPLFISNATAISSVRMPNMVSPVRELENPYEEATLVTPNSSFFSPYMDSDLDGSNLDRTSSRDHLLVKNEYLNT